MIEKEKWHKHVIHGSPSFSCTTSRFIFVNVYDDEQTLSPVVDIYPILGFECRVDDMYGRFGTYAPGDGPTTGKTHDEMIVEGWVYQHQTLVRVPLFLYPGYGIIDTELYAEYHKCEGDAFEVVEVTWEDRSRDERELKSVINQLAYRSRMVLRRMKEKEAAKLAATTLEALS